MVHLDSRIPHFVVSDEQRLAQVIANLLSNAVKFTPEQGSITLKTELVSEEKGVCMLQVSVTDTGIGSSREQQRKLFTSFEQADGGIARKFGGTGLGLAISKNIVQLMGGEIWTESELDKGATFSFRVPVQRGTSIQPSLLRDDVNWKNLRVLVVDDAPEVREYFRNFAAGIGLYCDVAANGEEAGRLIQEHATTPYNLAFVDWQMPDMNGVELTREIKSNISPDMVVIMISAAAWSDVEKEAKAAGVDDHIGKPIDMEEILTKLKKYLSPKE